jgi:hypothetical protein
MRGLMKIKAFMLQTARSGTHFEVASCMALDYPQFSNLLEHFPESPRLVNQVGARFRLDWGEALANLFIIH